MKNLNTMTNEELAISYMEGNNRAFDMLLQRTQDALFTLSVSAFSVNPPAISMTS